MQLEKKTKKELKQTHGQNYHVSRKEIKDQFQKKKLEGMTK